MKEERKKYLGKYSSGSMRLKNWKYDTDGLYFITVVTQNRVCNLGTIANEEMVLSAFGVIVQQEWHKSFDIRKELFLDEFVLMPNHLHAIVVIDAAAAKKASRPIIAAETDGRPIIAAETDGRPIIAAETDGRPNIAAETDGRPSVQNEKKIGIAERLPKSISSFLAGFKSGVNTAIDNYIDDNQLMLTKFNSKNHFFQSGYHDHIIRDDESYARIKNYIKNNPKNWRKDCFEK